MAAAISRSTVACLAIVVALLATSPPAAQALGASLTSNLAGQSAGGTVTLSGSGYLPGASIAVTFDGNPIATSPSAVKASSAGGFTAVKVTVPVGTAVGSHSIVASDGIDTASATLNVDALSVSPVGQSRGGTITLNGSGFAPGTAVTVSFSGTPITTATTDATGSFSNVQIAVPSTAAVGPHTLTATDAANDTASTRLEVDAISVTPSNGASDDALSVAGAGWPAGDAIQVQIGGSTVCELVADGEGVISGDQSNGCRVPPGLLPGSYPLTATDLTNDSSQATGSSFTVPVEPIAAFTGPPAGSPGSTLNFDGSASWAPKQIQSYAWNWGDGTTDTVSTATATTPAIATASHPYASPGNYVITLTITDATGQTNSVSHPVLIQGPLAAFTPTGATVLAGSDVLFDGTGSTDPGGLASYSWNLGDGAASATGPQTTHKYMQTGTFTVTLTVTDNAGNTASVSHEITVIAPPPVQTLILTPLAAPSLLKDGPRSITRTGLVKLGQRLFCPGPGTGCDLSIVATSRAVGAARTAGRRPLQIGHSHLAIPANASAALKFRLSKLARAYLGQQGRLPMRLTIAITRGSLSSKHVLGLTLRG